MYFLGPQSTRRLLEQIRAFQPDPNLGDAAKARVSRSRRRAAVALVVTGCVVIGLLGYWVAVGALACFAVPFAAYAALILKAPRDDDPSDGRR